MKEVPKLTVPNEDNKKVCPGCQKKARYRNKGVECKACLIWYHLECGNISGSEDANIAETVWYCMSGKKNKKKQLGLRRVLKFF